MRELMLKFYQVFRNCKRHQMFKVAMFLIVIVPYAITIDDVYFIFVLNMLR